MLTRAFTGFLGDFAAGFLGDAAFFAAGFLTAGFFAGDLCVDR